MTYLLVVDASHYQGTIDPQKVIAAGAVGIILKATEQLARGGPLDLSYAINKAACEAAGLFVGAYGFLDPADGKSQADLLLQTAGLDGKTAIAEDLEAAGDTLQEAEDFITEAHSATGVYGLLYTGNYVLNRIGGHTSKILGLCPLWLSQPGAVINVPLPWTTWALWQYGSINIGGVTFDANHFNGTLDDLKELWKMTSPVANLVQSQIKGTNFVPAFKTPGGELHSWLNAGDSVSLLSGSQQIDDSVTYFETPDDRWIRQENLTMTTPPPPPVTSVRYVSVGTSKLNVRKAASTSSEVLKQLVTGQKVEVYLPAQTIIPFFVQLATIDGVAATGWVSNTYLSVNPP